MSAKSILAQALVNNAALLALVGTDGNGNPRIYQSWHDSIRGYPQVTLTRVSETGSAHGDNGTLVLGTPIQIDVWISTSASSSPTPIEDAVKAAVRDDIPQHQRSEIRVIDDNADVTDKSYRITMQVTIYE